MTLLNLFADLQANPKNKATYHKLIDHYKLSGLNNEAEAFEELMRKKFDDNPDTNQEQRQDNQ